MVTGTYVTEFDELHSIFDHKSGDMKNMWEERYGAKEYAYGREPNGFFRQEIIKLPAGKVLVPGAGEGRDAVYAATLGWSVDAFDLSERGRDKALQLAGESGVAIDYAITDASAYRAEPEGYDAVALIYFHLPPAISAHIYREVAKALRPGGVLILEAFNPKQLNNTSGGPKDITWLVTAELLRQLFSDMKIVLCAEERVILSEGPYHQGAADVVRLVAVK